MQTRHIVMLALGGVIGTGLFLTSGYTVNQAGPLGAVIAYIIGALMVYMVMMCLGELAVQMPETGSFSTYATRFLGPGTGYTVAWLYWLTWTVAIGSEFTAAGILMTRWFPDTPVWIWSALFAGAVFFTNVVSVRLFAETEFWLSLIKVVTVRGVPDHRRRGDSRPVAISIRRTVPAWVTSPAKACSPPVSCRLP